MKSYLFGALARTLELLVFFIISFSKQLSLYERFTPFQLIEQQQKVILCPLDEIKLYSAMMTKAQSPCVHYCTPLLTTNLKFLHCVYHIVIQVEDHFTSFIILKQLSSAKSAHD